jgi:hypothetical protein
MSLKRLKINSKYKKNEYSAYRILGLNFRDAPPFAGRLAVPGLHSTSAF